MLATVELKDFQLIAIQWVLVAICAVLVGLRLYYRVYQRAIWHWSDIFVCFALAGTITFACLETAKYSLGWYLPIPLSELPLKDAIEGKKLQYGVTAVWSPTLYMVKFSMLCFYSELITVSMRKTRYALWGLSVFTLGCFLFTFGENLFFCKNHISDIWALDKPDEERKCFGPGFSLKVSGINLAFHLATDVFIYLFPLLIIFRLSLRRSQKIGVYMLFAIGFLAVANAFLYFFICFYLWEPAGLWQMFLAYWEHFWAIVVACCPAFKAILTTRLNPIITKWYRRTASLCCCCHTGRKKALMVSRGAGSGDLESGLSDKTGISGSGAPKLKSLNSLGSFASAIFRKTEKIGTTSNIMATLDESPTREVHSGQVNASTSMEKVQIDIDEKH